MQNWETCLATKKKKTSCALSLLLMKRAIPSKMKMSLEEDFVSIGAIFQARVEGPKHHQYEAIIRYVQIAPNDILWTIDTKNCTNSLLLLLALTKFQMVPTSVLEAWALRSSSMLTSLCWKEEPFQNLSLGRTVFIPNTSDINDSGRLVRSPDALRPLTLCNGDCKLLTFWKSRAWSWLMWRVLRQNQVFFWLTLLLLIPVSILLCGWEHCIALVLSPASCGVFTAAAPRTWNSREQPGDNFLWQRV